VSITLEARWIEGDPDDHQERQRREQEGNELIHCENPP
jgi:hypothetical protein